MGERTLITYEPNPLLGWIYHRFFENIQVDETWAKNVREADHRGTVVYVLRNRSFVDFLALDYLTKRLKLPQIKFVNDLGLSVLEPMGRGWMRALTPRAEDDDVADLQRVLEEGASAALFLKRSPRKLSPSARAKREGEGLVRSLLSLQRTHKTPILIVPQVFVWSKNPDKARPGAMDILFGPREWPGTVRTVSQFLMNYRAVTLRAGEPLDLARFLKEEGQDAEGREVPQDVLVKRLTYALLRRLERERRSVVGPTQKPQDRVRDEVLRSPRLLRVISNLAGDGQAERRVLVTRAETMLAELETALDMNAIRLLDAAFDRVRARMYTGFEVDKAGLERLREASREGTLVLLPSHKSHVDYILLSHLFYRANMPVPVVAAGDNLAFFPLGPVLRRAGAFFIRRSFKGDRLYGAVVDAYVRRLMKDGWPLEFFPEGGRSRTGKLLRPKLGLLAMVVEAALGTPSRKVFFCPISIGYERIVEENEYVHEVSGGEKEKEDVRGLVASLEKTLSRYGKLNVQFGETFTLEGVLAELDPNARLATLTPPKRRALVSRLAYRVMGEIAQITSLTPSALVATALLSHSHRGVAHVDLVERANWLAGRLKGFGARFSPSLLEGGGEDSHAPTLPIREQAIVEACDLFVRAGHVKAHLPGRPIGGKSKRTRVGGDAIYTITDEGRLSLDIAKNLVVHFFVNVGLVANALLASPGRTENEDVLRERVRFLSRLFKYEFTFRADATFETIFEETITELVASGDLAKEDGRLFLPNVEAEAHLGIYARILRSFLEGYRVAARGLSLLVKGPLAPKELVKRTLTAGERMFLAGEIACREAGSRPLIENAHLAFADQGYLVRTDGKLSLPESYAEGSASKIVEARIAALLPPV